MNRNNYAVTGTDKRQMRSNGVNKKKKSSAGEQIFYTFGTILLMIVVSICTLNFLRDGRAFVKSEVQASASANGAAPSDGQTAGNTNSNKSSAKSSGASKSNAGSDTASVPAAEKNTQNVSKPDGSVDGNLPEGGETSLNKPINPGEEP